jgi:hypothetical protein
MMAERIRVRDGVVPGVFPDAAGVEAAIAELRTLGFTDDELGIIVTDPEHHRLLDNSAREAMTGLEHGVLVGLPLGVLGGIALVALAAPGIGLIGLGGALLLGGTLGALWGGIGGSELGLLAAIRHLAQVEEQYEIHLTRGEVLVAVMVDPAPWHGHTPSRRRGVMLQRGRAPQPSAVMTMAQLPNALNYEWVGGVALDSLPGTQRRSWWAAMTKSKPATKGGRKRIATLNGSIVGGDPCMKMT